MLLVKSNQTFHLCYPEPDCGMASWEAQKYFKQLIAGVVSEFLVSLYFMQQISIYIPKILNGSDYGV
jgi:hypothetical protein